MEKQTKEVDVTKGLMKQTKAQLVEIILRKDDRERELLSEVKSLKAFKTNNSQEDIDNLREELDRRNKHIKKLMIEKNSIEADFQNHCDESVSVLQEYKNKTKLATLAAYIMSGVAILALLFGYMGI